MMKLTDFRRFEPLNRVIRQMEAPPRQPSDRHEPPDPLPPEKRRLYWTCMSEVFNNKVRFFIFKGKKKRKTLRLTKNIVRVLRKIEKRCEKIRSARQMRIGLEKDLQNKDRGDVRDAIEYKNEEIRDLEEQNEQDQQKIQAMKDAWANDAQRRKRLR